MLTKIIEVNEEENRFSNPLKTVKLADIPSTDWDVTSKLESEKSEVLQAIQEDSVYSQ